MPEEVSAKPLNGLQFIRSLPLLVAIGITPVWFLPVTQDPFDTAKFFLLVGAALIALFMVIFGNIRQCKLRITRSWPLAGLLLLTAATTSSVLFVSPNKAEGLLASFGPLSFLSLTILMAFGWSEWQKERQLVRNLLIGLASIMGIFATYQSLNLGKILFPGVTSLADPLWTPLGSPLALLIYLALIAPLSISIITKGIAHKNEKTVAAGAVAFLCIAAGFSITLIQFIPKVPTAFLPYQAGLATVVSAMKDPKTALFGVGPESFLTAYTAHRPPWLNMTALWNVRFSTNATYIFHMTSISGILGGIAFILFTLSLIPTKLTPGHLSRALAVIALFILPPTFPLIPLALAIYFVTEDHKTGTQTITLPGVPVIVKRGLLIVLLPFVVLGGYLALRAYAAEIVYFRSARPSATVNGTEVYNIQIEAVKLNPTSSRFRAAYSQTNLALASAIANANRVGTGSGQLENLSEKDKQIVTQLIQQSIREAKATANLAPKNVAAWENLGLVYQNLFGIAEGADKWAIAAFQQAITLDPTNPLLRQSLGTIYMAQQNYRDATAQFSAAIELKPDFANAYYNLANAYRMSGDNARAITELRRTQELLTPGTSDYIRATNELEELQNTTK